MPTLGFLDDFIVKKIKHKSLHNLYQQKVVLLDGKGIGMPP
jgi:hypothetical protein